MSLSDRRAWALLALAGGVSMGLLLWLNRGGTFSNDELVWFTNLGGENDLRSILAPHNSHLHGTTRSVYLLTMETVGTNYVVFRVLGALSVLLCAVLFFALAKRRVGTVPALVPSVLLLFYGSAWSHVVIPIGFTVLLSIAFGLVAFLALERDDPRGDAIACAALVLACFTFTVGLGFLVGAAISVLLRSDRLRRAWIFLIPLALYTAWWLWAQQFDQDRTSASQISEIVPFMAKSLAHSAGSLAGLGFSPDTLLDGELRQEPPGLGWLPAILVGGVLVWRIARGGVHPSVWASLGVVLTYWLAAALADSPLAPTVYAIRYVFPGTVGLLLVLTDLGRGVEFGRRATAAIVAVGAFSLAVNLAFLLDGARYYRDTYVPEARATLATFELASGREPGAGAGDGATREATPPVVADFIPLLGDDYLRAVERFGSPAYTLSDLEGQPEWVRTLADGELVAALGLTLEPAPGFDDGPACVTGGGQAELPPGGAVLRALGPGGAEVTLSRFGEPPGAAVGDLEAGEWSRLEIPPDASERPWLASIGGGPFKVCPVGATGLG